MDHLIAQRTSFDSSTEGVKADAGIAGDPFEE
jgi:hypothetical protein